MVKVFGVPDADTLPYDKLIEAVGDRPVAYIMHHQRMPVDVRPCMLPLSLRVQAVLESRAVVTALQASPGGRISITET